MGLLRASIALLVSTASKDQRIVATQILHVRKEHFLEYHERHTHGIPGLLALVLHLPVRFTDCPGAAAREQGVFKNSRGWIRGWELPEEETARLQELKADAMWWVCLMEHPDLRR